MVHVECRWLKGNTYTRTISSCGLPLKDDKNVSMLLSNFNSIPSIDCEWSTCFWSIRSGYSGIRTRFSKVDRYRIYQWATHSPFASIDSFVLNELYPNTCFQSWSITLSFASLMASFSSWLCALVHPNKVSLCIFRGLQGFCMASPSCTLKFSKTKNVTFLCRPL